MPAMDRLPFQLPHLPPTRLINTPPQLFGRRNPMDDIAIQSLEPELAAQMFPDPNNCGEGSEPKRRRIARACDICRRKKIKCDGKYPACGHCLHYKNQCVFTHIERKRNPPKGAKYIEGLENRLGRMETLLRRHGLVADGDNGATDLGTIDHRPVEEQQPSCHASQTAPSNPATPTSAVDTTASSTPHSSFFSPDSTLDVQDRRDGDERPVDLDPTLAPDKPKAGSPPHDYAEQEAVEALSELMCSLVTDQSGDTRYIGSSSGFSIFSPRGIQWVNENTGDASFQQIISDVSLDSHKWTNWKPEVFNDLFRRPLFIPLPPKDEAVSLIKDYFDNFNCMFPLFHAPTFMHLVELQYSGKPLEGSGWWASLNVVLATAKRLRVMSQLVPREEDDHAWAFLKNAMGVLAELTMRNTDLLSVQALLGIAMFMQGTPNQQPSFVLVAAAIRLAHSIGLHRRGTGFNLNPIELEQRKRVFWIAYMLDKDLCLRNGRPPAQDDDDVNVDLPELTPLDGIGNIPLADGKSVMNLFRVVCEFATIESKVYKRLYSTVATKQSASELLNTIGELDQELEDWKDRIPIDFRPEHEIKASHTPLMLHIVMLHFSYYNCLTTLHRMSVHHGCWTSRLSNYAIQGLSANPLNPRIFSSAALCAAAARAVISLLKYIPQNDNSCVWMILYFPVSAMITLFGNIIQHPVDSRAKSDVKLMKVVVSFLSMLGQEAETGGVLRMLSVCAELERKANIIIEKAEKEQVVRHKRKGCESPISNRPAIINLPMSLPQAGLQASTPLAVGPVNTPSIYSQAGTPPIDNINSYGQTEPSPCGYSQDMTATFPGTGFGNVSVSLHSPPLAGVKTKSEPSPPLTATWPLQMTGQDYPMSHDYMSFADLTGFGPNGLTSPLANTSDISYGQIFLPQDLNSLPLSLDWDWAEVSGGVYPSLENGNFNDFNQ